MACIFKRAISPEQKEVRRTQILDAAAARFEMNTFDTIKLASIAADVGITKAALYRYFRSKETLFLALFERAFEQVSTDVDKIDGDRLADTLCDILLDVPLYPRLSAILSIVLEHDLTVEEARAFKTFVLKHLNIVAKKLADKSDFDVETASAKLLQVQQALIGSWHMCHRSSVIERVVMEPALRSLALDFEACLRGLVTAIVNDGRT